MCAYLMNIYVVPMLRGKGIGRQIVTWLIAAAKARGITKIYLEASDAGKNLYTSMGFASMDGMMKLFQENV